MTGFLPFDKASGRTSFDEVYRLRKLFGEKRCGHAGTLDPLATGVLPVAFGAATRFIPLLPDHTKSYSAVFRTGLSTDTYDITGTVLQRSEKTVTLAEVRAALPAFSGDILQEPPMYSALKKNGVRLYELARKGIETAREKRPCTVSSLVANELPDGLFSLELTCSSGTYVRSIIHDLGLALGCGAVMVSLRRTRACGFSISACLNEERLLALRDEDLLETALVPVEQVFGLYPAIFVTPAQGVRFQNGGALSRERLGDSKTQADGRFRVYSEGIFLGLGLLSAEELSVEKLLPR